jgi:Peptidase family M20/M25/M40
MPDQRFHVDGARVLADLNTLRGIGAYKTGVHKPTFSEPHMRSLEWLVQRLPEAGLAGGIDGIGNVLGTRAKSGPKLLAGSHLESQNYAGWLDGPLGVVYALEAARVINPDPNVKGAVEVAAWCDEEGHFGSFLGSRSYVGGLTEGDIDAARDRNSDRTMRDALREVGLAGRPRAKAERGRYIGYLEAHIERPNAGKRRARHRKRHLHRRHLAIPDHFYRCAKPCRHDPDGRSQGCWARAGKVLRRYRRALPDRLRTAYGMDYRQHHDRAGGAEHHPGKGGNAVPDARR